MKKVTPQLYAEAFLAAAREPKAHADALVKSFVELLKKRGDFAHREIVMQAIEDKERAHAGRKFVEIESARPLPASELKTVKHLFHVESCDFEERVNEDLVAGVRITVDRERELDGTLQYMLKKIFN